MTELLPLIIVILMCLTGQLPKFEDDLFKINYVMNEEDAFLIPTGEVPLTSLLKGQLINSHTQGQSQSLLPLRYVCSSPCFRAEAGSRGRDTRGLLRQHQFQKVEIVKVCSPETSDEEYADMVSDVENLLISLELPFRKVLLCSSDLGFSSSICHDFEVWLPGQQQYREISSVSNCADFQSRRLGMRYRVAVPEAVLEAEAGKKGPNKQGKQKKTTTVFPHTMNGSGLAVGR
jgi:seryl-tRNA synthetase